MQRKLVDPSPLTKECRMAVLQALKPYQSQLSAMELLAIMAYTVGQMLALQDQRKVTPDMALTLVGRNIELGNADAIESLNQSQGSA